MVQGSVNSHMGAAPAFNITVDVPEDEARDLMDALADEFDQFERVGDTDKYRFEVPDEMDSGQMSRSNDSISITLYDGRNGYHGVSDGGGLLVHYSAYYFEQMETLQQKLAVLNDVNEFIEGWEPSGPVEYTAGSCTV